RGAHRRQLGVEELPLVDAHHLGLRADALEQLARRADALRLDLHRAVRGDVIVAVAVVELGLEDLDLALGDLGAAQAADQLFALAAEHAAGDDFNPPGPGSVRDVHLGLLQILAVFGPDADDVADVDVGGDVDHEPRLQRRRLDLRAGGRTGDPRRRVDHLQVDGDRQLDADRLVAVELHGDHHLGQDVVGVV